MELLNVKTEVEGTWNEWKKETFTETSEIIKNKNDILLCTSLNEEVNIKDGLKVDLAETNQENCKAEFDSEYFQLVDIYKEDAKLLEPKNENYSEQTPVYIEEARSFQYILSPTISKVEPQTHSALKSNLTEHIGTHANDKSYECQICNFKGVYEPNVAGHMKIRLGNGKTTAQKSDVTTLYECQNCNYTSVKKKHLLRHIKRIHTNEKPYKCQVCDYKTARKEHLASHLKIHTGEKPYQCDICSLQFAHKFNLNKHILANHGGEKQFKCQICNYESAYKVSLTQHVRTHTKEKPYGCNECNFKTASQSSLLRHRLIHTGEKPYQCHLCEFKSSQRASLNRHIRTHTGERPYHCYVCDYKSAQKPQLAKHILLLHREKKKKL